MADVTVVSSIIVQPENSNRSGGEKIHLTPFDLNLLQIDYTQRGLLFPKPDPGTRFISRLKTSLSSALDVYFPFAGLLAKWTIKKTRLCHFTSTATALVPDLFTPQLILSRWVIFFNLMAQFQKFSSFSSPWTVSKTSMASRKPCLH